MALTNPTMRARKRRPKLAPRPMPRPGAPRPMPRKPKTKVGTAWSQPPTFWPLKRK